MCSSLLYLGCRITSEWFMNWSTFPQQLRIWSGSEMTTGSGRLLYLLSRNSERKLKLGCCNDRFAVVIYFFIAWILKTLSLQLDTSTIIMQGFVCDIRAKGLAGLLSITMHVITKYSPSSNLSSACKIIQQSILYILPPSTLLTIPYH